MKPLPIPLLLLLSCAFPGVVRGQQLHSIGEPTDDEQLYLELINRSRANPAAEGVRLAASTDPWILAAFSQYGVNLNLMKTEFAALPARPPLAMNAKLLQAARAHTQEQFNRAVQSHNSATGATPLQRMVAAGYPANGSGENIYAYSMDTYYGHAALNTDWGVAPNGMQTGRGHRVSIHSGAYREIGVGVIFGENTVGGNTVGPQLVTQDFSAPAGTVPFVTGVAYYDLNGNSFYDAGEGIGGVGVTIPGAEWRAVTAASGGYAIPLAAGDGAKTVNFTGMGFNTTATAVVTGGGNVKVDLAPVYTAPVVTGPAEPGNGRAATYSWPAVPGAQSYEWRRMPRVAAATDAADTLAAVSTDVAGFTPRSTSVKQSGTASYRLIHPEPRTNSLRYPNAFLAGPAPSLRFHSRLRYASTTEIARVQVSTNGGSIWKDVYTQAGTDGAGESAFNDRLVSLASVAGKEFLLRFAYTVSESFFNTTGDNVGWYIDNIRFTDLLDTSGGVVTPVTGNAANFTPPSLGDFLLSARPLISGRRFPYGPALAVSAVPVSSGSYDFGNWVTVQEQMEGLPPGALSNPTADYNRDGIPNLAAYLMGVSAADTASLPAPAKTPSLVVFDYPRDTAATQGVLTPEISTDLKVWYAPGQAGAPAGYTDARLSLNGTREIRRASTPVVAGVDYYFRLRATTP